MYLANGLAQLALLSQSKQTCWHISDTNKLNHSIITQTINYHEEQTTKTHS